MQEIWRFDMLYKLFRSDCIEVVMSGNTEEELYGEPVVVWTEELSTEKDAISKAIECMKKAANPSEVYPLEFTLYQQHGIEWMPIILPQVRLVSGRPGLAGIFGLPEYAITYS